MGPCASKPSRGTSPPSTSTRSSTRPTRRCSAAEARLKANALSGAIDDYQLSFESGETVTGTFLVTRLDYAGDYNGERSYTIALESSGAVVSA